MTNNKTFRRFDMFIRVLFFPEFFNYPHRRRRLYFSDFISFLIQLLSNNDKAKGCGGRKKKKRRRRKRIILLRQGRRRSFPQFDSDDKTMGTRIIGE